MLSLEIKELLTGDSGTYDLVNASFSQNNILTLGQEGIEIDGEAAPGAIQNETTVMVASRAASNPLDQYVVPVFQTGLVVAGTMQGILPGRSFGNSTDKNTYRVVSISWYADIGPSGNSGGGWEMRLTNASASGNRFRF